MSLFQKILRWLGLQSKQDVPTSSQKAWKEKGDLFEKWVVSKFSREYFTLKEWRSDKGVKGVYAEANQHPDLIFEFHLREVKKTFAVECKWRQNYYKGGVQWTKKGQLQRYLTFSEEKEIPVFVVIGVGGSPDSPEELFVAPLTALKFVHATAEHLDKFRKKNFKNSNFFFDADKNLLK